MRDSYRIGRTRGLCLLAVAVGQKRQSPRKAGSVLQASKGLQLFDGTHLVLVDAGFFTVQLLEFVEP